MLILPSIFARQDAHDMIATGVACLVCARYGSVVEVLFESDVGIVQVTDGATGYVGDALTSVAQARIPSIEGRRGWLHGHRDVELAVKLRYLVLKRRRNMSKEVQ